nr:hypothetical protein [uncultured Cupriavidus sp.]
MRDTKHGGGGRQQMWLRCHNQHMYRCSAGKDRQPCQAQAGQVQQLTSAQGSQGGHVGTEWKYKCNVEAMAGSGVGAAFYLSLWFFYLRQIFPMQRLFEHSNSSFRHNRKVRMTAAGKKDKARTCLAAFLADGR